MKITIFFALMLTAFYANAAGIINCRGDLEDGYQFNLCSNVIDTAKLRTINCTKEIEDGYELNLCQNAKSINGDIIDCTADLGDGFEIKWCETVPVPNSVSYVDCLNDLEDGYQLNLCQNVNATEQAGLHKRL